MSVIQIVSNILFPEHTQPRYGASKKKINPARDYNRSLKDFFDASKRLDDIQKGTVESALLLKKSSERVLECLDCRMASVVNTQHCSVLEANCNEKK